MYNSKRASENVRIVTPIGVGIQENLLIKNIRVQESVNGNTFLVVDHERVNPDKSVSKNSHTEWEQNRFQNMTDKEYEVALDRQFSKLKQVVQALGYTSEEDLSFEGGWKELCNWVKTKWENSPLKNELFRIKFVYDNRNYVIYPKSSTRFIEPMSVTKEQSTIVIDPKYDKMTPVVGDNEPAKEAAASTSGFTVVTPTVDNTSMDDMPF